MCVPCRPGTGFERDAGSDNARRIRSLEQGVDALADLLIRVSPIRLQPDTSPQTLRNPDHSGHPVFQRVNPLANEALPPSLDTAPLIRAPAGL